MTNPQFSRNVGADRCVCPKRAKLVQASESQVYLSFYSECSQGSSPRSGVKVESLGFDGTGSNRSQVAWVPLSPYVTANSRIAPLF